MCDKHINLLQIHSKKSDVAKAWLSLLQGRLKFGFKTHAEKFPNNFQGSYIFDLLLDLRCNVKINVTVWFCVYSLYSVFIAVNVVLTHSSINTCIPQCHQLWFDLIVKMFKVFHENIQCYLQYYISIKMYLILYFFTLHLLNLNLKQH